MQVGAYALKGKADDLLRQLEVAERRDNEAEVKAKRYGCTAGLLLFGGLLTSLFAAAFLPLLLVGPPAFIAGIVFTVKRSREVKHDLDDRKLEAALRLLKVLRADIPSGEPVDLKLDFRDYRVGGRLVEKQAGWFASVKVYDYEHAWFDFTARLADGNVIAIAVKDEVTRKEKSKRKYTKVRERISSDVSLSVKLREGDAAQVQARLAGAPPGFAVRRVGGQGTHLRISLEGGQAISTHGRGSASTNGKPLDGDALLGALLWVYGGISPPGKAA